MKVFLSKNDSMDVKCENGNTHVTNWNSEKMYVVFSVDVFLNSFYTGYFSSFCRQLIFVVFNIKFFRKILS